MDSESRVVPVSAAFEQWWAEHGPYAVTHGSVPGREGEPAVAASIIGVFKDQAWTAWQASQAYVYPLLVEVDSLLSLAVYRGEGPHQEAWKREADNLSGRIRRITDPR